MTQPRIPPQPRKDWDDRTVEALSTLSPPRTARPSPQQQRPETNVTGILSWHPELTKAFLVFNNHLFRSTLSDRVREMATVRVSWLRRAEYEWAQHVRMAKAAGMSDAEIDAIGVGPDAQIWGPSDAVVLRSVDEMVNDRYISDDTWKQLAEQFDRRQIMDLVFTVGAYDLLAMALNTFGLELDPGLQGFPRQTPR